MGKNISSKKIKNYKSLKKLKKKISFKNKTRKRFKKYRTKKTKRHFKHGGYKLGNITEPMDPKKVPFKFNNLIKPIPSDLYRMDRVGKAMRRNN